MTQKAPGKKRLKRQARKDSKGARQEKTQKAGKKRLKRHARKN
jgi:hypothetical protein